MALTYVLIASNTLSSNAAFVTFNNIPNTYTDLIVKGSTRTDNDFLADSIYVQINGTTTNYSWTFLRGNGSSASSSRGNTESRLFMNASINGTLSTSNTFSNWDLYIPSYLASQNKQISSYSAVEDNSTTGWNVASANLWRNTAAITSLTFTVVTANKNFVSGSSFWLYGIKNTV